DTPAHREVWSAPRVGQRRDMPRVGPGRGSSAPRETGQRTRPASVTTGARRLSLRPIDDEGFPAMTRLLTLLSAAALALAAATAFAQGAGKSDAPAQAAPPSGSAAPSQDGKQSKKKKKSKASNSTQAPKAAPEG